MSKKNVEWEWKKLKDICNINFGTRVVRKKDGGSIYPVYGGGGATFMMDSYNREDCLVVSRFAMSQQCTRFVSGKFFLNDSGLSLSPKDNSLTESFLNTAILGLNDDIYALGRGTAQKNLNVDAFKELMLPIPPLDEQERIVKVLDDAFEKIDAIKTTAETNLQNAKDLFQTTLANELSITDEKIKQGWEEKTLDDCCEITSVLVDPKETKYRKLLHVGGANIESETGRLLDLQTAEEENLISGKFLFDDTMILYSKIRPYLKKIVQPDFSGLCSADIYPLNVKRNMNKGFLFYTLFSEPFTDFANKNSARAGMPKINRESLFAYKFFLPPLPIQKQIVAKLDSLSEKVKQLEFNYKQVLADCDELKKAILKKAFNGEL